MFALEPLKHERGQKEDENDREQNRTCAYVYILGFYIVWPSREIMINS